MRSGLTSLTFFLSPTLQDDGVDLWYCCRVNKTLGRLEAVGTGFS